MFLVPELETWCRNACTGRLLSTVRLVRAAVRKCGGGYEAVAGIRRTQPLNL